MKKFVKMIPNFITSIRIVGAIALIFLVPFSIPFFIVYSLCGFTDLLDGYIARKFHLESKLGSILDSVSDLFFLGIMAYKIFPKLVELLSFWNWLIIIIPTFLHISSYIICAFKFKKFSSLHTYANKIMSASIFFYPFVFIGEIRTLFEIYALVFGMVAIYGSVEINLIHIFAKRYDERNKSIFLVEKNEKDIGDYKNTEHQSI